MYICLCKGIGETEFCNILARHRACPQAVKCAMGLDESCCGRCAATVEDLIRHASSCLSGDVVLRDNCMPATVSVTNAGAFWWSNERWTFMGQYPDGNALIADGFAERVSGPSIL
jgi:bacterioferritin-associated ferredoxin